MKNAFNQSSADRDAFSDADTRISEVLDLDAKSGRGITWNYQN